MIAAGELHALKAQLFRLEQATVFAVLDGATVPDLPATLTSFRVEYRCLYRGELQPDMAEVAPYLVLLEREASFTDWLLLNGWGRNWGIFGISRADISVLNRHLRRFVKIDDGGRTLYWRYYDPRVMRNYLPTCTIDELKTIFGPANLYLMEDEDARLARQFMLAENALQQKKFTLHGIEASRVDPFAASVVLDEAMTGTTRLVVRPEQAKQAGEGIYVERMRSYLSEHFPESREVPPDVMGQTILELTERAAGYKLILETHLAPFIVAAWIFGTSFDEDFKAVKAVLEDYEMGTGMKAQWLWDFIEETVGILEDGMQSE